MKSCIFIVPLALALLLSGCMKVDAPIPATPSPEVMSLSESLQTSTPYSIRHTVLDSQGRNLSVFLETPVFEEVGEGYQKINAFFHQMEEDFFSPQNERLSGIWEDTSEAGMHTHCYEHSAKVLIQTEQLVCVQIEVYLATFRVFNWTDSYTFDVKTGERLTLSDLVEEPEDEALSMIWAALEASAQDDTFVWWDDIKERTLDDFDFFIKDSDVYLAFDPGEATMLSTGSFHVPLPVTLKQEWRSNEE